MTAKVLPVRYQRRHEADHVDEHFTRSARMRAGAGLGIAVPAVKRDIVHHPRVCIKPDFGDCEGGRTLVGEVQQRSAVAAPLLGRSHCDTVEEQVIRSFFEHREADVAAAARHEPHRGAVVAGNATHAAAKQVRTKILRTAAEHFECSEADLLLADGQVAIMGVPQRNIALGALAALANPLRGAVQPGTEPGLEATAYFGPAKGATAAGAHAMIIDIDPATMELRILKYVVVHDCGRVINPLIVAGQIHGGVAQGVGNAFYEQLVFDEEGQLINGTLADYLLPTAFEVPRIEILHHVTPSPYNELGVKGVGEAGAIPVGALFAQAIEDALELPARGIDILEIPLDPSHLWSLVDERAG